MNPVEQLQAAKEILMEKTWIKGAFRDDTKTAFCALGACYEAQGVPWTQDDGIAGGWGIHTEIDFLAATYLRQALRDKTGIIDVPTFNDDPATTFQDVMDLFDDAILLAKQKEAIDV